jgi:hypothetical protein
MKKHRQALTPCPYPTILYVPIVMISIMPLLSALTHITYVLIAFRALFPLVISTLVITVQLTHADTSWTTSWMLFQRVIKTWMKKRYPIDTWKYQGRGGVMS